MFGREYTFYLSCAINHVWPFLITFFFTKTIYKIYSAKVNSFKLFGVHIVTKGIDNILQANGYKRFR